MSKWRIGKNCTHRVPGIVTEDRQSEHSRLELTELQRAKINVGEKGRGPNNYRLEEMEDMNEPGCNIVGVEEEQQQVALTPLAASKSNALVPLPIASCSDEDKEKQNDAKLEAVEEGRRQMRERSLNNQWWGDCQPHIVLLREALLSSAPDVAVLGPLHGCFSFYMSHLHNEVLSSSYARTMLFGANASPLESSFMWMGSWRPTSALVLVYSHMGIQIEDALQSVRYGRSGVNESTTCLLTVRQLAVMHTLQKFTQHAELKLSKKHAVLQMLMGDQGMLEAVMLDAASPVANDSSRFDRATAKRMSRFRRLLVQAEDLRLHTLKDLLSLLTPVQAAYCGIATFELCSSMGEMGITAAPQLPPAVISAAATLPVLSDLAHPSPLANAVEPDLSGASASRSNLNLSDVPLDTSAGPALLVPSGNSDMDITAAPQLLSAAATLPIPSVLAHPSPSANAVEPFLSDVSASHYTLNSCDVLLDTSPQSALLLPSGSSQSPSSLLQHSSSSHQHVDLVNSSNLLSTALPLDDWTSERTEKMGPAKDHQANVDRYEGKLIASKLLFLSPTLSDVNIQSRILADTSNSRSNADQPEKIVLSNRVVTLSPAPSDAATQNCDFETSDLQSYFNLETQIPIADENSHLQTPDLPELHQLGESKQRAIHHLVTEHHNECER